MLPKGRVWKQEENNIQIKNVFASRQKPVSNAKDGIKTEKVAELARLNKKKTKVYVQVKYSAMKMTLKISVVFYRIFMSL